MRTPAKASGETLGALHAETDVLEEVIIDVRSAACFAAGHLPGATHFEGPDGPDGLSSVSPSFRRKRVVRACARASSAMLLHPARPASRCCFPLALAARSLFCPITQSNPQTLHL